MSTIIYPDYDKSILSVTSSILKRFGIQSEYASLKEIDKYMEKEYKNIVFVILDCMGMNILKNNLDENSFFRKNIKAVVNSVFPSTTIAATTAFHSGLSPLESGWIGWMPYFKEYNEIIEIFTSKTFYTSKKLDIPSIGDTILKYETIYSKICNKNPNIKYHKVFPAFDKNGVKNIREFCDSIDKACQSKNKINLISAYWDEPDYTIHRRGTNSKETKKVLEDLNENLENLAKHLNDTLMIISADHGAIDVEEVYINEIKELDDCLEMPPSIETRFVTFFVKEMKKDYFKEKFKEIFKDDFLLYTKKDFLESGLLGKGKMHYKIDEFIGDFVAISISKKSIRYTVNGKKFKRLIADHAGLTKEEMEVPVIIFERK